MSSRRLLQAYREFQESITPIPREVEYFKLVTPFRVANKPRRSIAGRHAGSAHGPTHPEIDEELHTSYDDRFTATYV